MWGLQTVDILLPETNSPPTNSSNAYSPATPETRLYTICSRYRGSFAECFKHPLISQKGCPTLKSHHEDAGQMKEEKSETKTRRRVRYHCLPRIRQVFKAPAILRLLSSKNVKGTRHSSFSETSPGISPSIIFLSLSPWLPTVRPQRGDPVVISPAMSCVYLCVCMIHTLPVSLNYTSGCNLSLRGVGRVYGAVKQTAKT